VDALREESFPTPFPREEHGRVHTGILPRGVDRLRQLGAAPVDVHEAEFSRRAPGCRPPADLLLHGLDLRDVLEGRHRPTTSPDPDRDPVHQDLGLAEVDEPADVWLPLRRASVKLIDGITRQRGFQRFSRGMPVTDCATGLKIVIFPSRSTAMIPSYCNPASP
jgi:hypothetical protein